MEIGLTAQLRRLCCISMRAERAFAVPDHDSRAVPCRAVPCRAVPDHSFPRQDRLSLTCRLSVPGSSIGSISECIAAAEPNSSSDQVGGSVHRHPCARSRMGMGRVICLCSFAAADMFSEHVGSSGRSVAGHLLPRRSISTLAFYPPIKKVQGLLLNIFTQNSGYILPFVVNYQHYFYHCRSRPWTCKLPSFTFTGVSGVLECLVFYHQELRRLSLTLIEEIFTTARVDDCVLVETFDGHT